jgi:hypothetical protein
MNNLIIKLNDSNSLQTSPEGVKINKLVSSISPLNFIKLLHKADNKVNPRIANVNRITKSIHETLETSPELMLFKSKGLLIATESCKILERNRVELTFDNQEFEGIMDGGHNTFAIAIYLIKKLFDVNIKKWDDCKEFWNKNYDEITKRFVERENEFKFSIPIEIVTPNDEEGSVEEYYDNLSEICSARNNNVQLSETAKGNQEGYYDYLKETLNLKFDVIWKTGDSGKIKSEDIIRLSTIHIFFLKDNELLPKEIKNLNKISIYSQKSKCVDFFNTVMDHKEVSLEKNGRHILKNKYVESALALTEDILRFFDKMYIEFPNLYHAASPGKFGRIGAVNNKVEGRVPFYTTERNADYQYPFGFFIPLIVGLTQLMEVDEENQRVIWSVNPNDLDLSTLDLTQYVNIIKLVNYDPQKIGKGEVFYNDAETVFNKIALSAV